MANIVPAEMLKGMSVRIGQILPKIIDKKRFLQIIMESFRLNPKLSQCTNDSVVAAVLKCCREGLEPGEECYLIPRKNYKTQQLECVYQRGYVGVLTLARRSGQFASINVGVVREGDDYELIEGTDNRLVIRRALSARGDILFYWASSKMTSGEVSFDVLSVEEAAEHRDKFASTRRGGEITGPWAEHFDSMAIKTVLIKHLKYKPRKYDVDIFEREDEENDTQAAQQVATGAGSIIDMLPPSDPVPPIDLTDQVQTVTSNPEMVKKYQEVIDKMTTAEQIDKWRSGIQAALERDLPNEDDQMAIYAYAEDAYQTLKG